jgi:hypothetical protein
MRNYNKVRNVNDVINRVGGGGRWRAPPPRASLAGLHHERLFRSRRRETIPEIFLA